MKTLIFLLLFLSGCSTPSKESILSDRQVILMETSVGLVQCEQAIRYNCGLRIYSCSNGMIYDCVNNAQILDFDELMKYLKSFGTL
jgi:hypothetical protein